MCVKKGLLVGSLILATVLFISVGARNATSEVANGRHDLSTSYSSPLHTQPYQFQTSEICVFCHTPHGSNTNQTYVTDPGTTGTAGTLGGQWLWNRALPNRSWQVYDSETYDANKYTGHDPNNGQPGLLSLMCLSCHDGVGAMNVLVNYPNADGPLAAGSGNQIGELGASTFLNIGDASCPPQSGGSDNCTGGNDLRNDHPIGFNYDDDMVPDGGLKTITNAALLKRMVITKNRMECSTCHDPHLTNSAANGNLFLVMSMDRSELCLQCHNK